MQGFYLPIPKGQNTISWQELSQIFNQTWHSDKNGELSQILYVSWTRNRSSVAISGINILIHTMQPGSISLPENLVRSHQNILWHALSQDSNT